jgi:DNA-binding response OmpR family regulator
MATILVVEDEIDLNNLIRSELEADGHVVVQVFEGPTAVQQAGARPFDLIILDWMLPGLDGLAVCRQIRQQSLVPIVMLTARTELVDRVLGLEVGADDYIGKPFSMHELRARIFAVLRRVAFERQAPPASPLEQHNATTPAGNAPRLKTSAPLIVGPVRIQQDERTVTLNGELIDLTRKEYELLLLFASYPGRTFSREFLLEQIWSDNYDVMDRVVDTQITRLRKKLGPFGEKLVTVWGIGYRLLR